MKPILVDPVLMTDDAWFIHTDDKTPQWIKDTYLNKEITDGEKTILVTGVSFPGRPFNWANGPGYLVELEYNHSAFEKFGDIC